MEQLSIFRENTDSAREICTWEYPERLRNFSLGPKETNVYDESVLQGIWGDRWGSEMLDVIPKSSKGQDFFYSDYPAFHIKCM